ncbi:FeoB small GTPase domain-containing protein [Elusimicrobiota bacterium]
MKIFLVGNPNVGKSVLFSRLTGLDVMVCNYSGSTVEFCKGEVKFWEHKSELIDIPGLYSLRPANKAEEVAADILKDFKDGDILINVIDAINLERNLFLTLELLEKKIPTIIVLNRWDLTKSHGIEINYSKLIQKLGVPVLPVVGVSGEGIKELVETMDKCLHNPFLSNTNIPEHKEDKWKLIGEIVSQCQKLYHHHPTLLEKLQELSITMPYAIFIAAGVLIGSFVIVRTIGESLVNYVLDPLFSKIYLPNLQALINVIGLPAWLNSLLMGAKPEPMAAFGLLTTGLYVPFVILLPYIFAFYLILSFIEDSGYLVRIAIVMDKVLHKIGLHGYASIPVLLGLGCKVPAIMSTRILESKKERIIALALILLLFPCIPQTVMVYSVLTKYGVTVVVSVFAFVFLLGLGVSFALNKFLKGETPELFVEVPIYQIPRFKQLAKKVFIRLKEFIMETVPLIIVGIALVSILDMIGVIKIIANVLGPIVTGLLGLPKELSIVMISGFLRKDVSIALLIPFDLTLKQMVIASVFLIMYLPCIATFFIMVKEFSAKTAVKVSVLTLLFSIIVGSALNLIL